MTDDSLERWRRASGLFDRVRDLDPASRAALLAETCGTDVELIRLVEQLVEDARSAGLPGEGPEAATLRDTTLHASDEIGPYRLLQKIGEGGMGEVWRAEQTRPIRREVALKVIKAGLDTKRVVARFEMERQVLALMDHPAIAKVYEAGETPRGLPYFAMEYVAGDPVTEYCDRHRLGTKERLDLFARICAGVQHAHEKGVIHRDLKPSNVLVTLQGDRPVPKIIDFGVAKATAHHLAERTLYTELGVMIGTPSYMSPEQAEMTGLNVDTRTDVYALGVMLYELLTGVLPFDAKTLREAGYDEIRRRIREVDPPRPSTRAEKLGEDSAEIARKRGTVPSKLVSRLRGDLDWIVMKCLEKDRTRRYASPNELAADLKRHLAHEPVAAGPPGAAYRTRKFVRRHRIGVGVAAAAVVALGTFTVLTLAQNRRIAAERDRADQEAEISQRVTDFMTGLFEVSDPSEARGNTITAREILDRGAEKIGKELDEEPEVKARLLLSMGNVYLKLGLFPTAEPMLEEAVGSLRKVRGPEDPETLRAASLLSLAYGDLKRYADAETLLRTTLEAQQRILGEEHEDTISTLAHLAWTLDRQERSDEAGAIYRKVLEIRRRTLGPDDPRLFASIHDLGEHLHFVGKPDEAEPLLREAADGCRRVLGNDHPQTLRDLNNLADDLGLLGHLGEAETIDREVLETRTRVLGPDHPATITSMGTLAGVLLEERRPRESEAMYRAAFEARSRLLGPEDPGTTAVEGMLALALTNEGRLEEAEEIFRKTLEIRRRVPGLADRATTSLMGNLGVLYFMMDRLDDASKLLEEAYEARAKAQGETDPVAGFCAYNVACIEALRGRTADALAWLRKSAAGDFGGSGADDIRNDEDLKSLRGNPEFEALVASARAGAGIGGTFVPFGATSPTDSLAPPRSP